MLKALLDVSVKGLYAEQNGQNRKYQRKQVNGPTNVSDDR